ncbi:uncharacterized protein LOC106946869 isoform X2 [Poecilia latipinna]|uniref:uncharacterized protein LOC106946869 isoform X2 n=1 Tax=Poecilia latipinna TaxID=48699 RepID=UPI00072E3BB8|nr:PREDICTED: uncharacterized protein LOC106946869 isoform X2 [Poecilia latipinna]
MKVSCVSQGDSPQYSWTLDGHTLTDSELFSRNTRTNIIVLRQNISGHLVCSVRNQVSNSSKEMNLNYCVEKTSCDGRQHGAQCFANLRGAVDIQLTNNVSEIPRFTWIKGNSIILKWRKKKIVTPKNDRIPFFPSNGSVRINDLTRTDSGEYKIDMFDEDGYMMGCRTLQLFVQAPVSSVQLSHDCLSQGQMKVSCVSQGDSPQYSWTLDGHTLTDSELFSRNTETNIIVLRQNISGHLVCSVRNQVSNSSKEMNLAGCEMKPSCDGRQNGAQCFGVLGGAVDVQLMDDVSEIPRFKWNINNSAIFFWKNNKVVPSKDDRIPFFPSNGSVRINDLTRTDSGEYELEMFDGNGKNIGWRTLQLFVKAPVSSVQLSHDCLSQGQMKVSCVSQGDSPQYSWTLDGHTLTDSELFSRNTETNIIVLRQNISGHLVCSVRNQVSNSSKEMNLAGCAVKTSCDGRKNGTQCFGVLGGAVDVQLMDDVSEISRFTWKRNNSVILFWRNNKVVTSKDDRIPFFPSNGSVRINDLRRNDSDEYKLDMFDENGKETGRRTLQLLVKAPVSSVQLSHDCLSQGQMKVSCVSQGDSPQYSWTLDGHTLTDSELFSRNTETNIIVLRQNISGHLVCSVRNQVSNSSKEMNLAGCGFINCTSNGTQIAKWVYKENNTLCVEPTTVPPTTKYTSVGKKTQSNTSASSPNDNGHPWYIRLLPVMGGVLAALVIVLIASIAFICVHKKKKNTKVEKEDDDQEMTYADVRIVKKQGRRVEKSEEADVEYGQVKFSKKPRISQTNPTVDDTVYAQVRKGR